MKWVIVFGNPGDGFRLVGPFDDVNDANDWADRHIARHDYWCMQMVHPDYKE